jgi:glycosyltransferase involved in cell wall biosynthesis
MNGEQKHISVCICTFKRLRLLKRLLNKLECQRTDGRFGYSIVVADNDSEQSAKQLVSNFLETSTVSSIYCVEPQKNIALVRNKAVENARGEFIAFIDDDEFPVDDWLLNLLTTCERFGVAGVLGPVRPHFEQSPPRWIVKGGFCERLEYATGRVMEWSESRTGNVLFRRSLLGGIPRVFNPEFANGGEDKDFFLQMTGRGNVFVWCNEGIVYETVEPARWRRGFMLKRALLRGKNILKHPTGRVRILIKSVFAVPTYAAVLPVSLLLGQHLFMRYAIKLCDHLGRILAIFGMNPIREREM